MEAKDEVSADRLPWGKSAEEEGNSRNSCRTVQRHRWPLTASMRLS
jgi:hypothetical protein